MRISVDKREALRERVQKLIPHMKKSDIVKHFEIEGITIDRMQTMNKISENKKKQDFLHPGNLLGKPNSNS